jgi:hypothetical protein
MTKGSRRPRAWLRIQSCPQGARRNVVSIELLNLASGDRAGKNGVSIVPEKGMHCSEVSGT